MVDFEDLPTLVVCEQGDQWAAAMRRLWRGRLVALRETRRLDDCWQAVAKFPCCLVALEWQPARRAELVGFLDRLDRWFPDARPIALAGRSGDDDQQWLAREAGVIHFVHSSRQLGPVRRIVERLAKSSSPQLKNLPRH